MYPYIITPYGNISVFTCCVAVGITFLFISLYTSLKHAVNPDEEMSYIAPKVVVAGLGGFLFALAVDFLFKYREYKEVKLYGMTFYGSLIGASLVFYFLLNISKESTQYSPKEWFDIITIPFILFHIFGRIGCFFGGCCYGCYSDSIIAVTFPDNEAAGIIHNGMSRLPCQLFEAGALLIILLIVYCVRRKYLLYLASYALIRFFLEFLRGDDRGKGIGVLSPSQVISVLIIASLLVYQMRSLFIQWRKRRKKTK